MTNVLCLRELFNKMSLFDLICRGYFLGIFEKKLGYFYSCQNADHNVPIKIKNSLILKNATYYCNSSEIEIFLI